MIRLPKLDPRRRIASLFLLPDCDMACRFCASERGFSTMDAKVAAELLALLRERGFASVVFGGGEPSLWPHGLERLTDRARRLGFVVQVCTNGVGLPDDFADDASVDRYILPLESTDPAVHDRLRIHHGGHHALMLRRIEQLAGSGRALTVSTVITRDNLGEIDALADYLRGARERGVRLHAWHLYRFLPVGRGGRPNAERLTVSRADFLDACERAKQAGLGCRVYRRDNMLRSSSVEFFWAEEGRLRIGSLSRGHST
jgi:MoaA/NifB/PqqE/SkfB family radical SAM enzyme